MVEPRYQNRQMVVGHPAGTPEQPYGGNTELFEFWVRSVLGVKMRKWLFSEETTVELGKPGVRPVAMVPCFRYLSEKWVVLAERG